VEKHVLRIVASRACQNEKIWTMDVVFRQFLGLDYHLVFSDDLSPHGIRIEMEGSSIHVNSEFFERAESRWLGQSSMPRPAVEWKGAILGGFGRRGTVSPPLIFGTNRFEKQGNSLFVGIDLFGSMFFFLSRYEELVNPARDAHGRFSARESYAGNNSLLLRPLVNEYLEVLWGLLSTTWPMLSRRNREFRTIVSVDVDYLYSCSTKSIKRLFMEVGRDLLRDKHVRRAVRALFNYVAAKKGQYKFDQYLSLLYWIMDVNEAEGNSVQYNFIAKKDGGLLDINGCYSLGESVAVRVIGDIISRGHSIGLHCSYYSPYDVDAVSQELGNLQAVISHNNLDFVVSSCRCHYLRWDGKITPRVLDAAGLKFDSTLGYADSVGFRAGTCYEYTMYDLAGRRSLDLIESPLLVMDTSLFDKSYLGLGYGDRAVELIEVIKNTVRRYSGDFTILWHNSNLVEQNARRVYRKAIRS